MISRKKRLYLFGAPIVIGLAASPLFATTEPADQVGRSFVDTTKIELVFPQLAQVGGDEIGGGGGGGSDNDEENDRFNPPVPSGPEVKASQARTTQIVTQLEQIQQICEFMGDEYRIACFGQTYRELADSIPANGDYEEAREVILEAARELDNLVRRNIDRQKPALTARLTTPTGETVRTPPIAAVREDRAPRLAQQAADIIEEAETVLLRSASSDATRAIHFQRIAAAVGSNKVLLRSS